MIYRACYIAIFLHFIRKIFRRALPEVAKRFSRRYLVLVGPYEDKEIGKYMTVVASTSDLTVAKRIGIEINEGGATGLGGLGPNAYIVSYPGLRVIGVFTYFESDRDTNIRWLNENIGSMSLQSIFSSIGIALMCSSVKTRLKLIAMKYEQSWDTTDIDTTDV